MESAVREDLAFPRSVERPTDPWSPHFRRRVFRVASSGLELDALRNGPVPAHGLKGRAPARDPLAECFAFAARWEAPLLAAAEEPDGFDACLDASDQAAPAF